MATRRKASKLHASAIALALPATSANLGPAFDAAALAFQLYLKVEARLAEEFTIAVSGRDDDVCGRLENHLILTTYREVLERAGKTALPLAVKIRNEIPIGKGCGSSAAARLAGIALAVHFGKLGWSDQRIVGEASAREHHPDNAAACWMGGVVVARMSSDAEAEVIKIKPKGGWPLLLAVPPDPLSTEEARRVLPTQYSREDAVVNVQNSMMLLAALTQGRRDSLATALRDRLHQPYRAALCPLLPALQACVGKDGIRGVALSGAGPSVLVFLDPKIPATRSLAAARACLKGSGLSAELLLTAIAEKGARDGSAWKQRSRSKKSRR
jgi:homoserine kinase